jgi:hypothetical protein
VWILLAWVGFAASLVIAYFGLFHTVESGVTEAAPPRTFASGETATFELTPEDRPVLYASTTGLVNFTCEATTASGGPVALTRPGYRVSFTAGDRIWEYIFDIGVTAPGTYRITCQAPASSDIVFGVGRQYGGEQVAETAGGILLYAGLVFLAFVAAIVVTVLVPVLRRRNRRRLAGTLPPYPPGGR